MLKRMRWRFIGAAMAAIGAVVLALLCLISFWSYRNMTSQQDALLSGLMEMENRNESTPGKPGVPDFDYLRKFSPEVQYSLRFFAVHFNGAGNVVRVNQANIASVTQETAESYAQSVVEKGKSQGFYNGYRYLVQENENGTVVLFLNSERELQTENNLISISAAIAGLCLGAVFLLVFLFSGRAILPYVRNLTAQKEFITNASHELKTPLTAISTSADVLAMEYEGDEWVSNIQAQSARLSKLIGGLVTLSRLDEENPFPEKSDFSLSDAVWETAEPFTSLAQAKNLAYTQEIADDLHFSGDRAAVQQMVSILLDNAVKYTPEGGKISLKLTGKKPILEIANTCAPGETTDVSRLFERFYRPDESHNRKTGGTGLGLAIAKATAQAQGAEITACRTDDQIRFRIKF